MPVLNDRERAWYSDFTNRFSEGMFGLTREEREAGFKRWLNVLQGTREPRIVKGDHLARFRYDAAISSGDGQRSDEIDDGAWTIQPAGVALGIRHHAANETHLLDLPDRPAAALGFVVNGGKVAPIQEAGYFMPWGGSLESNSTRAAEVTVNLTADAAERALLRLETDRVPLEMIVRGGDSAVTSTSGNARVIVYYGAANPRKGIRFTLADATDGVDTSDEHGNGWVARLAASAADGGAIESAMKMVEMQYLVGTTAGVFAAAVNAALGTTSAYVNSGVAGDDLDDPSFDDKHAARIFTGGHPTTYAFIDVFLVTL